MEIDLAQLDNSATGSDLLRAPICIIGGGIAGLTLAHKLVALGHEILLLEAGGHASDAFSPIQQAGHPHPGTSEPRPRALGGTSLTGAASSSHSRMTATGPSQAPTSRPSLPKPNNFSASTHSRTPPPNSSRSSINPHQHC